MTYSCVVVRCKVMSVQTLRRNVLPPSSGWMNCVHVENEGATWPIIQERCKFRPIGDPERKNGLLTYLLTHYGRRVVAHGQRDIIKLTLGVTRLVKAPKMVDNANFLSHPKAPLHYSSIYLIAVAAVHTGKNTQPISHYLTSRCTRLHSEVHDTQITAYSVTCAHVTSDTHFVVRHKARAFGVEVLKWGSQSPRIDPMLGQARNATAPSRCLTF
jgi:hypothetical protein